jgi:hypothetical protein
MKCPLRGFAGITLGGFETEAVLTGNDVCQICGYDQRDRAPIAPAFDALKVLRFGISAEWVIEERITWLESLKAYGLKDSDREMIASILEATPQDIKELKESRDS